MRTLTILLLALCCLPAWAGWRDDVTPAAHLSGQGQLCIIGFCLYDAQMWSQRSPIAYDAPFALRVTYKRSIKRDSFVDTGIDEIKRLAPTPIPVETLARWRTDMQRGLTDVTPGDRLCAVFLPDRGVRFYANGRMSAEIDDPQFARAFFGIWLDPHTRAPALRRDLLGNEKNPSVD